MPVAKRMGHVPDRRRGARAAESFIMALRIQRRVERLDIEPADNQAHVANPATAKLSIPTEAADAFFRLSGFAINRC